MCVCRVAGLLDEPHSLCGLKAAVAGLKEANAWTHIASFGQSEQSPAYTGCNSCWPLKARVHSHLVSLTMLDSVFSRTDAICPFKSLLRVHSPESSFVSGRRNTKKETNKEEGQAGEEERLASRRRVQLVVQTTVENQQYYPSSESMAKSLAQLTKVDRYWARLLAIGDRKCLQYKHASRSTRARVEDGIRSSPAMISV